MLLPIPIGYFVSIFLFISGVLNCMEYLDNKPEDCTRAALLNGLAEAGWPIIAGSVLLLLIQINKQLEQLRLQVVVEPVAGTAGKKVKKKAQPAKEAPAPPQQVPVPTPVPPVGAPVWQGPIPATQHAAIPITTAKPMTTPTPPPVKPTTKPIYPNSPIPGGGRVPQMPTAADTPAPKSSKKGEVQEGSGKLSYFKVD